MDKDDMHRAIEVDLENPKQAYQLLKALQQTRPDELAKYVRITVKGFAWIRAAVLHAIVETMPSLHEMWLPDREWELNLLVVLCDFVEPLCDTNPRLREIVFKDYRKEALWNRDYS